MHFTSVLLGLSAAAGTALASTTASLFVHNNCAKDVYLIYSNNAYKSAAKTLASGMGFEVVLSGEGYSVGFSKSPNFYATNVAKLIMGYSINTASDLLYYSFTNNDGNAFAGQSWKPVGSGDCPNVNTADKVTYPCTPATQKLTLCN